MNERHKYAHLFTSVKDGLPTKDDIDILEFCYVILENSIIIPAFFDTETNTFDYYVRPDEKISLTVTHYLLLSKIDKKIKELTQLNKFLHWTIKDHRQYEKELRGIISERNTSLENLKKERDEKDKNDL